MQPHEAEILVYFKDFIQYPLVHKGLSDSLYILNHNGMVGFHSPDVTRLWNSGNIISITKQSVSWIKNKEVVNG